MPDCIDLKERFGDKYRVAYEESYAAERGERAFARDPWMSIVLCQHGHIFPHGSTTLAASTDRRGPIARALFRLPCCTAHQDGDDGVTVLFDVAHFLKIAKLLKPRRRRHLSPEQRAACAERLAKHRPEALRQAAEKRAKIAPTPDAAQNTTPPPDGDSSPHFSQRGIVGASGG